MDMGTADDDTYEMDKKRTHQAESIRKSRVIKFRMRRRQYAKIWHDMINFQDELL